MRGKTIFFVLALAAAVFLAGCSFGKKEVAYQDGTFSGVSDNKNIEVAVTVKDNKITAVDIVEFDDAGNQKDINVYQICVEGGTAPLLAEAHPTLAKRIIDKNSWDVDVFSGATSSSNSIREAAKAALQTAQK
ncbi:MAG TPA: FMN-binding protein [Firmicutes bacterium]|nr:FMN-binding protein [Bacillota bacterium]